MPIVLMEGRYKWVASIIAVSLVGIFVFFFANYLMGIIWPAPAFQTWLLNQDVLPLGSRGITRIRAFYQVTPCA
jgi:hypothetical protein